MLRLHGHRGGAMHLVTMLMACVANTIHASSTIPSTIPQNVSNNPVLSRSRLIFRYPLAMGLCNQHLAQISAVLAAIHLQANVIHIPPPVFRNTFKEHMTKTKWTATNHSSIWDMQVLQEYLEQKHNITMIKQTDIEQGVDAFASDYDIQFTTPQGAADEQVVVLPLKWGERADLDEWVSKAHAVIHAHVAKHQPTLMDIQATHGTVDLFLTVNMLPLLAFQLDKVPNVVSVARHLDFTPQLHNIATTLVRNLRREYNTAVFNGAHLRMEGDAAAWHDMFSNGRQTVWEYYTEAAAMVGFNTSVPVYVASAVWQTGNKEVIQEVEEWVYHHASALVHRRSLLRDAAEIEEQLHSEQLAAVDLLVMAEASNVVGMCYSSFSWYLAELRAMQGHARTTFASVHVTGAFVDWREPGAFFAV